MKRQLKLLSTAVFLAVIAFSCGSDDASPNSNDKDGDKYPTTSEISSIPQPTLGKRWVLQELWSDEFNGTELDGTKWLPFHKNWNGREPGRFLERNVSVGSGYLQLKGSTLTNEEKSTYGESWTMGCAAVSSVNPVFSYDVNDTEQFGYFECRYKANKTTLSSTFWMSSYGNTTSDVSNGGGGLGGQPMSGNQPSSLLYTDGTTSAYGGSGTFRQEIDICECIGRVDDDNSAGSIRMSAGMNSNTHMFYTTTNNDVINVDISEAQQVCDTSGEFNTYGCWWHDKSAATFYLNNNDGLYREFKSSENNATFYMPTPMNSINLVVETYTTSWIAPPSDSELEDTSVNTTYYDWVRSYKLIDAGVDDAGAATTAVFDENIHFDQSPSTLTLSQNGKVTVELSYTVNKTSEIEFLFYDKSDELVASETYVAYGGYQHFEHELDASLLESGSSYYVVAYIRESSSMNNESAYAGDSFKFTLN